MAAFTLTPPQALAKQALHNELARQRRLALAFGGQRWFERWRYARYNQAEAGDHPITALNSIAQ